MVVLQGVICFVVIHVRTIATLDAMEVVAEDAQIRVRHRVLVHLSVKIVLLDALIVLGIVLVRARHLQLTVPYLVQRYFINLKYRKCIFYV